MSKRCHGDDREDGSHVPVACSLARGELAAQRDALLPGLLSRATDREPMQRRAVDEEPPATGFRWRFDFEAGILAEIAAVIEAEHRCCPFLRFELVVTPGDGPLCLEVTGPEGTAEFLSTLLDDA